MMGRVWNCNFTKKFVLKLQIHLMDVHYVEWNVVDNLSICRKHQARLTIYIKTIYFIATVTEEMHLSCSLSKLILFAALKFYSLSKTNLHLQSKKECINKKSISILIIESLKRSNAWKNFTQVIFFQEVFIKNDWETLKSYCCNYSLYFSLLIVDLSNYFIFMHYAY